MMSEREKNKFQRKLVDNLDFVIEEGQRNAPADTTRTETDLGGCDVYTGLYPIVVVLAVAEVVE